VSNITAEKILLKGQQRNLAPTVQSNQKLNRTFKKLRK
jgi:hypothetical protein